jgi:flotillin
MLAGLLADSGSAAAILIAFVLLFVVVVVMAIIARLIVVGNPSEMLIISGRRQRDGVGYRIVIGGRTLVIPLIEHVARLSLRNMQVPLEVKAQAGGGTMVPVIVTGVANVKVSSDPSERANAIERFLGQPAEQLQRVSKETLEGGLRAVIGK